MEDQTRPVCAEKRQPENAFKRLGRIRFGRLPHYGVRLVIGRVLFILPVRLFELVPELDIEFPREDELPIVELLIVELEYEFEFDIVLLDIVDELPYEFVPPIELLFI